MAEAAEPAIEDTRGHALAAVIRGASVALLGSIVGGGFGFLFPVVMARVLPQSSFGQLVLALNVLLAASALGTAGADYAAIRGVAAADSPGDKRGAMRTPILFVLVLDVAVALALAGFAGPLARHVFGQPGFVWPLRALALVLPITVLAQMFSASLSGLERASGELVRKVVEQGGRVALAPLGVAVGLGVAGAVVGMAVAAIAGAIGVAWLLLRALPHGGTTRPVSVRSVVVFAWPQTIANVTAQVWQLAIVVILAQYTSTKVVALYGAAVALARLPALVYNSFSFRFSPAIARLWANGEREELSHLLQSVTRWVSMAALPFYAVAVAVPAALLLVYGREYREAALALALVSLGSLCNSLAGPVEWTLIMTGRVKLEMAANVGAAIPLLALAFWLIPAYGLTGAAVASLLYAVAINAAKTVFVLRALQLRAFSAAILRPLGAAAGAGAVAALVEHGAGVGDALVGALALVGIVVVVYAIALTAFGGMSRADRAAFALAVRGR